jgi:hypothetical protein
MSEEGNNKYDRIKFRRIVVYILTFFILRIIRSSFSPIKYMISIYTLSIFNDERDVRL